MNQKNNKLALLYKDPETSKHLCLVLAYHRMVRGRTHQQSYIYTSSLLAMSIGHHLLIQ
nr:MAG TPA: hypothetical protein [Caudoviricetes sp.]